MTEPSVNGSLSVVVPMDDMTQILTQLWKSRQTEPKIGELYEKYKKLVNDLSVSGGRWKYDYCSECPKTGQGANHVDGLLDYGFGLSEFVDVKLY